MHHMHMAINIHIMAIAMGYCSEKLTRNWLEADEPRHIITLLIYVSMYTLIIFCILRRRPTS